MKRRIRRRMCTSKVRYSEERKVSGLIDLLARAGLPMKLYRCRCCGALSGRGELRASEELFS